MSDNHALPRRTRAHVIAALGVNHIERQILLAGYVVEREYFDYGVDLVMKTFDTDGQVDPGRLFLQVKATDHFAPSADGAVVVVRVDVGALKNWLMEWTPVVLAIYDAEADRAYWLDVQEYARNEDLDTDAAGATVSLRVPTANVFTAATARHLRDMILKVAPNTPKNEEGAP